jgi:hypothetical protein
VSDEFRGFRFGELLLKAIFGFVETNGYVGAFVTVLPKYADLLDLLGDFGFADTTRRMSLGEVVLAKRFTPDPAITDPLEYNVRFGPSAFIRDADRAHLIPIQPRFRDVLFPETAPMQSLFPGRHAFGNGIRKAYLCNAPIRILPTGAPLLFYRSERERGIIAVGVLERFLVSRNADEIAREVGRRTVYRFAEIQELASRGDVLILFFRQSRVLLPYVDVRELEAASVISGPPQSIQRVREEGAKWLYQRIAA